MRTEGASGSGPRVIGISPGGIPKSGLVREGPPGHKSRSMETKTSDAGVEEVRSQAAVIRFEAKKCIHSRHCVLARPDVFVPNIQGEWIHPEVATAEEIAELAHNCPSGAITYQRLDGGASETPPRVNLVRVRENGPLAFHAELELTSTSTPMPTPMNEGSTDSFRATLCRCGASKNKPYCDGSHNAAGFKTTGEPPTLESQPLAARAGVLKVTAQPDGPLRVEGNLEVVSGTGRTINRLTKTAFCRCGQSASKPYCDGTHAKVGFKTT